MLGFSIKSVFLIQNATFRAFYDQRDGIGALLPKKCLSGAIPCETRLELPGGPRKAPQRI